MVTTEGRSSGSTFLLGTQQSGDTTEHVICDRGGIAVVIPYPPMALPYEQEHPLTKDDWTLEASGQMSFKLPIAVRVEVFPAPQRGSHDRSECFLIATKNTLSWGRGGDGLTATGCTQKCDFTFRTNVFGNFPRVRHHNRVLLKENEWNEMVLAISEEMATYWINGVPVATCFLQERDLPSKQLFLGLTSYIAPFRYRNFDVTRDPSILSCFRHRVITLHMEEPEQGHVQARCLNISGSVAAVLDEVVGPEGNDNEEIGEFRKRLALEIGVLPHNLKLVLPDGTLLDNSLDGELLRDLLHWESLGGQHRAIHKKRKVIPSLISTLRSQCRVLGSRKSWR